MARPPGQPHDTLVRSVFREPERFELLLRMALGPGDLADLALETLELAPTQSVSLVLKSASTDLVFRVRARRHGGPGAAAGPGSCSCSST